MNKEFYEKYGKEFHCATCQELTTCVNRPEPLFSNCCEQFLRDKISDLEAKLALYDEVIKEREDDLETLFLIRDNLEQQLAEKEKEVQRTHNYYQAVRNRETIQESKLDFAIAELEKVRKEFETKLTGCKWEDKMLVGKFCNTTNEILDNKIEELKEMKSE